MRGYLSTTRGRLVLLQVLLLGGAILLADLTVYVLIAVSEGQAADDVLNAQATNIANSITVTNGQAAFDVGLASETDTGIAVAAALVQATGTIIQTPHQPLSMPKLLQLAASARGGPVWTTVNDAHGVPRRVLAQPMSLTDVPAPAGPAVLITSRSVAEMQAGLSRAAFFLVALSSLVVVLGGVLAHRLGGRVLGPVRQVAALARSLGRPDLHGRVDVRVPADEMKELVDTFNELLGRVEDSFQSLRRFTADASHELRTPLALMRAEVDSVLARARTDKEYREALVEVRQEVDRMTRLADHLLYLARADAGVLVPASSPVDIADLLYDTAGRWAKVAAAKGVKLEVSAPSSGTVPSDPDLLRRVFDNLVDNAIRHSPAGGKVELEARRSNGTWEMRVSDEGPGIPSELRSRMFTRFARSDDSRHNGAGAGLGLALSRAIVEAHNGRLELDSTRAGASFRIELPATRVGAA